MEENLQQLERELFCAEQRFVKFYNEMAKAQEEVDMWRKEMQSLTLRIDRLKNAVMVKQP